ncbi:MAG: FtsX-like permease family protein [Terracidiphilus sp.]|jgi:putative ABC transport system permease protein
MSTSPNAIVPQLSFAGFAWKNLWRRRLRTALTLGGITMGIGAFVALVGFSRAFEREWLRMYTSSGIDIAVVETNLINSSLDQSVGAKIDTIPDVAQVTPIIFNLMDLTPEVNALAYGWRADCYELDSLTMLSGRRFHDGQPEVLLGDLLASNLNKKVGDILPIQGTTFTVVGIFHGGTALEAGAVILPLDQMQMISSMQGKVTAFHVRLRPTPANESYDHYVKRAQAAIEAVLPGTKAVPAAERAANNQIVDLAHSVAWGTSLIALLVGILGIANTMAMSVFERTREIGILRALGWKGRHVILLILTEATVLGIAGGLLGIAVGWGALGMLSTLPQTAAVVSPSVSPYHLLESLFIAIASGLAAGAYPAWRAAQLSPVEALRYE